MIKSPKRLHNTIHNPSSACYSAKNITIPSLKRYVMGSDISIPTAKLLADTKYRYASVSQASYVRDLISGKKQISKMQAKASDDIEQLFKTLKKVLYETEAETNRNSALKNLIIIMEQDKGKLEIEDSLATSEIRQVKKIQSNIIKYSNVTNQLLGKIKTLKQEIYTSRKNRAMFSVKFRDIERQLKIYEDKYKKLLLVSENSVSKHNLEIVTAITQERSKFLFEKDMGNTKIFEESFQGNNFLTQPFEDEYNHRNQSPLAHNFYCSSKKLLHLVKPRKQYVSSMRNISKAQQTENKVKSLEIFLEKVSAVAGISFRKLHQSLGPTGFMVKNEELYKKVCKFNEHIGKYQKKIRKLKEGIKLKGLINHEQARDKKKLTIGRSLSQKKQVTPKFRPSEQSFKRISQEKASDLLDEKIYTQILYLTNSKKIQSIKSSPSNLSVQRCQDSIHELLLSKIDTILSKESRKIRSKTPKNQTTANQSRVTPQSKIRQQPHKVEFERRKNFSPSIKLNDQDPPGSQNNLNSLLSNMKVYASYQRAFQRIEFETEYYYERNRKGKKIGSGLIQQK